MTPLAGFVVAIIAGWIIRDPRRAAAAVLVPFLAVLAVQTWSLAAGHGDNPPSTIHGVSYWVVQAIILAFALGIATQLAIVLRARTGARGGGGGCGGGWGGGWGGGGGGEPACAAGHRRAAGPDRRVGNRVR